MPEAILETTLPFPKRQGKVRDVYDLGDEQLLIIATDRISAFDCVMPNGIPDKGKLLTALSLFWFEKLKDVVPNHLIATDVSKMPAALHKHEKVLTGRSMLVKKTRVIPIECVARGYLAGSAWSEYTKTGNACGLKLPPNLRQCSALPKPVFTPATKEETGHDINISFDRMCELIPAELAMKLQKLTLELYSKAALHAKSKGVIIADTKFEFGQLPDGSVILIDEVLTPDSSRFWPANEYETGHDQPSFDKQFVRNWLNAQDWNKQPPAPVLPAEVVIGTKQRYIDAFEKITGENWMVRKVR
jgi:phosphoribosylaminoimidazole-succinocarboxamide synthase